MKNPGTGHKTEKTNKGTKETGVIQLGPDLSQVMEGRRGEKGREIKEVTISGCYRAFSGA